MTRERDFTSARRCAACHPRNFVYNEYEPNGGGTMKRFLCLLLALCTAFCGVAVAFAEETPDARDELINRIIYYIKRYNEQATPFSWNYTGKPLTV